MAIIFQKFQMLGHQARPDIGMRLIIGEQHGVKHAASWHRLGLQKMQKSAGTICKNADMDWNDLRYVLAISRAGTLAAASRRLRVDQTTVARRLAEAERALGARLFERMDGSLRPTRIGERAILQAAQVEQEVEALERGIGGADARIVGSVRLTAVPVLVNRLLVREAATLQAAHAEAIAKAVRAGLGKSVLPCFTADRDPGLQRLSDKVVLARELWLLTHEALRHQPRIAAVVDWLGTLVKARLR